MKRLVTVLAVAGLSLGSAPLAAQEAVLAPVSPVLGTSGAVDNLLGQSSIGEPATAEELADARGGYAVAVVIGGLVVAVRSCATNVVCRTVAAAIIKALGKKAGEIIIERSTPALHQKLCRSGFRRYC